MTFLFKCDTILEDTLKNKQQKKRKNIDMSDPTSTPASGSPGGPGIKIPPAGGPPTNPKKQTVRISVPPKRSAPPTPPVADPEKDDSRDDGDTENEPSRLERVGLILTEYKTFFTICFCLIAVVLAVWFCLPKDYTLTSAKVDANIKNERDLLRKEKRELKEKLAAMEKEVIGVSNIYFSLQKENMDLLEAMQSNNVQRAKATLPSNSNPVKVTQTSPPAQPTNQTVAQTEPPKNVGSGLVTVNENHGDIKIIIKSSDGERSVRTSSGPAEDIIPGLAEATGTESPIITDKMISSQGNGIRYYLPKGWSMSFTYFGSENDFELFINKGTRQVTKWEAIDVSSDGISESIWIKSRRNIRFRFTLTPAK